MITLSQIHRRALAFAIALLVPAGVWAASPVISDPPHDISVPVLNPAGFQVVVIPQAGNELTYQWRRNGAPIPGATNDNYFIVPCASDHGAKFSVAISNGIDKATLSADAVLSVTKGTTDGTITFQQGVSPTPGYNMFATYMTPGKGNDFATQTNNFQGNNTDGYMGLHSTDAPFLNRMVWAFDLSAIPAGSTIRSARLEFQGVPYADGESVAANYDLHWVTNAAALFQAGETRVNWAFPWINFGGDFDPAQRIARIYTKGAAANDKRFAFGSTPFMVNAIQKALDAGEHRIAFVAKGSDETTHFTTLEIRTDDWATVEERPSFTISFTQPTCPEALAPESAIVTGPSSLTVDAGTPAVFKAVPQLGADEQATYQWYRGNTAIPGATGAFYLIVPTTTDNGATFTVAVATTGKKPVRSSAATLTVTPASPAFSTLVFQQGVSPSTNYDMIAAYMPRGQSDAEALEYSVGFWTHIEVAYMGRFSEANPYLNRLFFAFDLSAIPAGSTILSAELAFTGQGGVEYGAGSSTGNTWNLHAIRTRDVDALFNGGESFVNWLFPWSVPGTDYDPTVLSSITTGGGAENNARHTWASSPAFVSAIQAELGRPQRHVAFVAKGRDESVLGTTMGVKTDDVTTPEDRPKFTMTFRIPASIPVLSARLAGNNLVLTWTGTGPRLQSSPTLAPASWTDINGASGVQIPLGTGNRFFRLIQ